MTCINCLCQILTRGTGSSVFYINYPNTCTRLILFISLQPAPPHCIPYLALPPTPTHMSCPIQAEPAQSLDGSRPKTNMMMRKKSPPMRNTQAL